MFDFQKFLEINNLSEEFQIYNENDDEYYLAYSNKGHKLRVRKFGRSVVVRIEIFIFNKKFEIEREILSDLKISSKSLFLESELKVYYKDLDLNELYSNIHLLKILNLDNISLQNIKEYPLPIIYPNNILYFSNKLSSLKIDRLKEFLEDMENLKNSINKFKEKYLN